MPAMTTLLRSLVVWLLLLAMPFQAYASATMMPCASQIHDAKSLMTMAPFHDHDHAAMMVPGHDHAAMLAAMANAGAASQQLHPDHHADHCTNNAHAMRAKCDCAACCVGAVLASSATAAALPALENLSEPPALYADFLPAVDLAHPERPPQSPRA